MFFFNLFNNNYQQKKLNIKKIKENYELYLNDNKIVLFINFFNILIFLCEIYLIYFYTKKKI